jgi:hypothetical protein
VGVIFSLRENGIHAENGEKNQQNGRREKKFFDSENLLVEFDLSALLINVILNILNHRKS